MRRLRNHAVGIVGLGQIGGSLFKALSRYRPDLQLYGHDARAEYAAAVRRYGRWCGDLDDLIDACDVVVLAVPADAIITLLPVIAARVQHRPHRRRLLVCDTGTIKAPVVSAARVWRERFDFVGTHPIAGSAHAAWDSADESTFRDHPWVVCPAAPRADARARELVRLAGGTPVVIDARLHDAIVAEAIGAPHVLAYAAAGALRRAGRQDALRGGSWRSLTRVSASDPRMVAGFLHGNAANQIRALRDLRTALDRVERALRAPSPRTLEGLLAVWQARARTPRGSA